MLGAHSVGWAMVGDAADSTTGPTPPTETQNLAGDNLVGFFGMGFGMLGGDAPIVAAPTGPPPVGNLDNWMLGASGIGWAMLGGDATVTTTEAGDLDNWMLGAAGIGWTMLGGDGYALAIVSHTASISAYVGAAIKRTFGLTLDAGQAPLLTHAPDYEPPVATLTTLYT